MKEIYLAGGCFWGTEHYFKQIAGVVATEVGYANGTTAHPTYEEVCRNDTGHAETVRIAYHPDEIGLDFLLEMFFKAIDPTSLNRQGHDEGTQYRTGIYYTDPADGVRAEQFCRSKQADYDAPIVVEVAPLAAFYPAEEYHQSYLDKNPTGYCHLSPELFKMARESRKKP